MPNPNGKDDIVINLPTLDPNSIYSVANGGTSPFGNTNPLYNNVPHLGASGSASLSSPLQGTGGVANPFAGMANPRAGFGGTYGQTPFAAIGGVGGTQGLGVSGSIGKELGQGGKVGGLHPDEAKWKAVAEKIGLNWQVVKDVYMNPSRNGTPSVSKAISRAADDKAWGDSAFKYGILNGDYWHDKQVWIDHYNAGGNMQYDPMVGHNDAISTYEQNQQALEQQANGTEQYPDWYQPPAP